MNKRNFLNYKGMIGLLLVLFALSLTAQERVDPSDRISVVGKIKQERQFTLSELASMEAVAIPDLTITGTKGEIKGKVTGLKGIPIKSLLEKIEFQVDKPKELSEFFLVFEATDGYRVVFSWNELFNTSTGNTVYIITEKDGKKINVMPERILLTSSSDFATGRRYVKGLCRIVLSRCEKTPQKN
jgi:hypothetical protein